MQIPDLSEVPHELIRDHLDEAASRLQETFPQLHLKRGVLHDTLLMLHAVLMGSSRLAIQRYLSARSLQQINQDPTLADEQTVQDILSNWRLERQTSTKAYGTVGMVLSRRRSITIPVNYRLTIGGQEFRTLQTWAVQVAAEQLGSPYEVLLVQLATDRFLFPIEVEAVEAGEASNLPKGTEALPASPPPSFYQAYLITDTAGGQEVETNDQLLHRMREGIGNKTLGNRLTMQASLREFPSFSRIGHQSIIGYGDPEMLRDRTSLPPISHGGRVDWYIRTQPELQRLGVVRQAVLLQIDPDGSGVWQFSIPSSLFPGFYEVRYVRPLDAGPALGGLEILEDIREINHEIPGILPDLQTPEEAAYTAYQAATIRFRDPVLPADAQPGMQREYAIELTGLPLIREIQEHVNHRDYACYGADVLIHAPVPCFVQMHFRIFKQATDPSPDLAGIRDSLRTTVNSLGFHGRIDASKLYEVIHGYLPNAASVGLLDLWGRIRRPDGSLLYLRDPSALEVPSDPSRMVTFRTVGFFVDPDDIGIDVVTGIPE